MEKENKELQLEIFSLEKRLREFEILQQKYQEIYSLYAKLQQEFEGLR